MPTTLNTGASMSSTLFEREITLPAPTSDGPVLQGLARRTLARIDHDLVPIRMAVAASTNSEYRCEVGLMQGWSRSRPDSLFRFDRRQLRNQDSFNAVLLIPTGIGAEIGGHAGDGSPIAALLASVCDTLITHPNVVNASDIFSLPANALYVEGSVITRLLMGCAGVQRTRSNRLLVILGHHQDQLFTNAAINSVNAARVAYGLKAPVIAQLGPEFEMEARYTASGRAAGEVRGLELLWEALDRYQGEYDAVAITSQIIVPPGYHTEYFESGGEMVNPWGGVEAMLTHAVSAGYNLPSAHSPMLETREIANSDPGIVDPRMAAEAVSLSLIQCILKGLQHSPQIITDQEDMRRPGVLTAEGVSCLVIPAGCLGLPTLAALEQGITVIAVRENTNLMRNDLKALPWSPGQLLVVDNYWEAAGVMAALKAGIEPRAARRPVEPARVEDTGCRLAAS